MARVTTQALHGLSGALGAATGLLRVAPYGFQGLGVEPGEPVHGFGVGRSHPLGLSPAVLSRLGLHARGAGVGGPSVGV
jgi:hypothetical protein